MKHSKVPRGRIVVLLKIIWFHKSHQKSLKVRAPMKDRERVRRYLIKGGKGYLMSRD